MNLRLPYERLIADKLRRLPAPGADASWQEMKRLLDDDEDMRPGGRRRPPGGWWKLGVLAIALMSGAWLYMETGSTRTATVAKNNTSAVQQVNTSDKTNDQDKHTTHKNSTTDNNTTLTPLANNQNSQPGSSSADEARDNAKMVSPANSSSANGSLSGASSSDFAAVKSAPSKASNVDATAPHSSSVGVAGARDRHAVSNSNTPQTAEFTSTPSFYKKAHFKQKYSGNNDAEAATLSNSDEQPFSIVPDKHTSANKSDRQLFASLNDLPSTDIRKWSATDLLPGDSIETNRNGTNLLNADTKKAVTRAQRDKTLEDMTKKENKGIHLNLSNLFKPFSMRVEPEPRWAAGIALSSYIPLSPQQRFNYNMNGKSGTLLDYIPSLYLQFHLNDFVYMQTELNFVTPQYTPQLLVYQENNSLLSPAGNSSQKNIYVQKLYYFSLPVSLHYSPINNVYFSAGLQFSSFQSGLATIQEKQYVTQTGPDHPSSISSTVLKFKDDSIAAKLNPNEWRWQAGADYYWNRFTLGLRYNQAFSQLVNKDAIPAAPASSVRNQSLVLYLRYNLFESRKKNQPQN